MENQDCNIRIPKGTKLVNQMAKMAEAGTTLQLAVNLILADCKFGHADRMTRGVILDRLEAAADAYDKAFHQSMQDASL